MYLEWPTSGHTTIALTSWAQRSLLDLSNFFTCPGSAVLSLLHQAREEGYQSSQVPCQKVIRYSFKAGWAGQLCSIIARINMGLRFYVPHLGWSASCSSARWQNFCARSYLIEKLMSPVKKSRFGSLLVFFHKFCSFIQKLIDRVGRSRTREWICKRRSHNTQLKTY